MNESMILKSLKRVSELIEGKGPLDLTLIGGAAGMLTSEFDSSRVTTDCDIVSLIPIEKLSEIERVGRMVSREFSLSEDWLNGRAIDLDVLPSGWKSRRVLKLKIKDFSVYCLGRLDLLATKVYACSARDRQDNESMKPDRQELKFAKDHLYFLMVPSRNADKDQIQKALMYLETIGR